MTTTYDPETFLQDIVEEIQVPQTRYDQARRSYSAVGDHLNRKDGPLAQYDPQIYVQGSFRLGTAIRPVNDAEEYDIDLVCELALTTNAVTQEQLKTNVGDDLGAYTLRHRMAPPEESRRCWTLNYADGVQFHLDVLPALPDSNRQRMLLESRGHDGAMADAAIAITDNETLEYKGYTVEWPRSNPKGYAEWFKRRMGTLFEQRHRALTLEAAARGQVEDVPTYRVQTPLQQLVQLLKHHRDRCFVDLNSDNKPISIIITTLAAHAYREEATLADAIRSVLPRMQDYIESRNGVRWVANPTNPDENFADRWVTHPEREEAFEIWHQRAISDFEAVVSAGSRAEALSAIEESVSERVRTAAARERRPMSAGFRRLVGRLTNRQAQSPPWPAGREGIVEVTHAELSRNGYRETNICSDAERLWKNSRLKFVAKTDVPHPIDVYWQVINTGAEAEVANGLRGGFDKGVVTRGQLTNNETASYTGQHSVECFIVKDGYLVARSGQFIVNIR